MTAAVEQNFTTYAGDAAIVGFTVQDQNGVAIDISTVSAISWSAFRAWTAAPVLTKTKAGGAITFVTNGIDGQFQVSLANGDTAPLTGSYLHKALILDASGNETTVALGRMTIGPPPTWNYDSTQLAANQIMQIRLQIGDTVSTDQQFLDEELAQFLAVRGSVDGAAANACRSLSAKFGRFVNVTAGGSKVQYGDIAKRYAAMAIVFDQSASSGGAGSMPYAGGVSIADNQSQEQNSDLTPPQFWLGSMDNLDLPVGPNDNPVTS